MAEILEREGYRVKLKVEVPASEVNKAYDAVVREYAGKVRVPGFRPGKAPAKVIEARLGRESLLEEVKERLLDTSYPKAVKELELFPVGVKLLEANLEEGQPFTYVAEVENYPEVKLPDWREFKLEVPPIEVTDELVEQALQDLRTRYGELVPVERPIEAKDQVFIETEDGARFPVDMEKALEHVREALLGKSTGDEVMVPVKDGDAVVKELKTKVLEVKALQLPELDEEFAKTVGEESLEVLRGKVRMSLESQAARTVQEAKAEQLLEKLAEGLEAEIPPTMLNHEQQHLLEHMAEDLQKEKTTLQDYLKKLEDEGKLEEFRTDLKTSAEKRIRRALAKEKLQEELGTELTEEEWNAYLTDMARAYRTNLASLKKELGEESLERLRVQRLQDKALAEALQKLE